MAEANVRIAEKSLSLAENQYDTADPRAAPRLPQRRDGRHAHRLLSSSFLGLPYRILNMNHKKELLRSLWVFRVSCAGVSGGAAWPAAGSNRSAVR